MNKLFLALVFAVSTSFSFAQSADEAAVRKLFDDQRAAIFKADTKELERVFADDFVVTNPFNQFLTKREVIERTAEGGISMESFERTLDYVKVYGDFAVVAGKESGVWGAKSPLPGKPINLRFTAVARKVKGKWAEVARHASIVQPPPAQQSQLAANATPNAPAAAADKRPMIIPDTFENLQVLPKDISKSDLMKLMKPLSSVGGGRCMKCHTVNDELTEGNFASDDKPEKAKARALLKAMQEIDRKYAAAGK
jgi:ketosteroid isomerase-like protein